jgi:chromosomal replication initiator protein
VWFGVLLRANPKGAPLITDDRELVSAIRSRLSERVGQDRYEVWFGPSTQLAVRGDTLQVSASSQFFQEWLRSHFRKDLEVCAEEACGRALVLEFRIAAAAPEKPATARAVKNGSAKATAKSAERPAADRAEVAANGHAETLRIVSDASDNSPADASAANTTASAATNGTELPPAPAVEMPRRKLSSLDGFVVGHSNCLAHKAAQMAVLQPGAYSPLLVHGPTSTGKTHLLEGIYSAFRKSHPRAAAVYLSAEQFTSQFLAALHKSGMASFRSKYRDLELLVLDDLQFLAGKKATIGELQHTIDTLLRRGKQLVFAADRAPAALKVLGPELTSRLSGGMVCRLEPAEYATRLGIVRMQAVQLGMNVPAEVQAYIATHLTSQARELSGALKRLHAMSLAHNRPIDMHLAEETLAELVDHQGRVVKLPDIEKAVCGVFGLEPESLQSGRKGKLVSHPRMLAMYLARKYTRAPLTEIGNYFGKRSHSTVISAQKKIEGWMADSSTQKLAETSLSLEETIRRVEAQLRAG